MGAHLCQFTSAYFPRGNRVTSAAVRSLSQSDWTTHVICADANCHHANWDKHVAPNPSKGEKRIETSAARAIALSKQMIRIRCSSRSYFCLASYNVSVATEWNTVGITLILINIKSRHRLLFLKKAISKETVPGPLLVLV